MTDDLRQLNVRLPSPLLQELRVMSIREGRSTSDMVRDALIAQYPALKQTAKQTEIPVSRKRGRK